MIHILPRRTGTTHRWVVFEVTRSDHGLSSCRSGEYRLLRILLDHPNRVLNRDQLTEMIHGREAEAYDRAIDVQVSRLRQRLRDDSREPTLIKTVRGEGYVLAAWPKRSGCSRRMTRRSVPDRHQCVAGEHERRRAGAWATHQHRGAS